MSRRGRRMLVASAVVAALALGADSLRPPQRQVSARLLLAAIGRYQLYVSPLLARAGVSCRFRPTCSHYAQGAIEKSGAIVGSLRALWRVLRCGPWTPAGTVDPP